MQLEHTCQVSDNYDLKLAQWQGAKIIMDGKELKQNYRNVFVLQLVILVIARGTEYKMNKVVIFG